jgi:hypothetical protein
MQMLLISIRLIGDCWFNLVPFCNPVVVGIFNRFHSLFIVDASESLSITRGHKGWYIINALRTHNNTKKYIYKYSLAKSVV